MKLQIIVVIFIYIIFHSVTVFCTFEDVDRATNILNLVSPTIDE